MNYRQPQKTIVVLLTALLLTSTLTTKSWPNDTYDSSELELVFGLGTSLIAIVLNVPLIIANDRLLQQGEGSLILGTSGLLVGLSSIAFGAWFVYSVLENDSTANGISIFGLMVGAVGLGSTVLGAKSLRQFLAAKPKRSRERTTLRPITVSTIDGTTGVGIDIRIVF